MIYPPYVEVFLKNFIFFHIAFSAEQFLFRDLFSYTSIYILVFFMFFLFFIGILFCCYWPDWLKRSFIFVCQNKKLNVTLLMFWLSSKSGMRSGM